MRKLFLVLSAFAITHANAQNPDPIKLGDVTFTATLRSRVYAWDWFNPAAPGYQNEYAYSGNLLRLNIAEKRGALDLDAEFAVPFLLSLPKNATAPAPQGALGLGSNYYAANKRNEYSAMIFPTLSPCFTFRLGGKKDERY